MLTSRIKVKEIKHFKVYKVFSKTQFQWFWGVLSHPILTSLILEMQNQANWHLTLPGKIHKMSGINHIKFDKNIWLRADFLAA